MLRILLHFSDAHVLWFFLCFPKWLETFCCLFPEVGIRDLGIMNLCTMLCSLWKTKNSLPSMRFWRLPGNVSLIADDLFKILSTSGIIKKISIFLVVRSPVNPANIWYNCSPQLYFIHCVSTIPTNWVSIYCDDRIKEVEELCKGSLESVYSLYPTLCRLQILEELEIIGHMLCR